MNWLVISPPRGTWRGGWIPPGRSPAAWPQTAPRGAGTPPCHCCCCPASPGSLAQAGTPAGQCNGERMGNIGGPTTYILQQMKRRLKMAVSLWGSWIEFGRFWAYQFGCRNGIGVFLLVRVWSFWQKKIVELKVDKCHRPQATNTCSFSHLLNCLVISLNFF